MIWGCQKGEATPGSISKKVTGHFGAPQRIDMLKCARDLLYCRNVNQQEALKSCPTSSGIHGVCVLLEYRYNLSQ